MHLSDKGEHGEQANTLDFTCVDTGTGLSD